MVFLHRFLVSFVLLTLSFYGFSATFTSVASGPWDSPSTWDCGCVPPRTSTTAAEIDDNDFIISAPHVVTFNGTVQKRRSTVGGSLTVNGTLLARDMIVRFPLPINGSGDIILSNNYIQDLFANVTMSPTLTALRFTVSGGFFENTSSVTVTGGNVILRPLSRPQVSGAVILNSIDIQGGGSLMVNGGGPVTVNMITIGTGNINVDGGSDVTFLGDLSSINSLTLDGGSVVNISGDATFGNIAAEGGATLSIQGSLTTGDVSLLGNSPLTVGGRAELGDLAIDGSSIVTFNGDSTFVNNLTSNGGSDVIGSSILSYSSIVLNDFGKVCGNDNQSDFEGNFIVDLSTCTVVLPIILSYFDARLEDGLVKFGWETLEEVDNDYFTLEYSLHGKLFTGFADLDGAGYSSSPISYEYTDTRLVDEGYDLLYFRLKQTDFDGEFTYSPIVSLGLNGSSVSDLFYLVPNPAKDYAQLKMIQFDEDEIYTARLINALSLGSSQEFKVVNGQADLDLTGLTSGVYYLQIEGFLKVSKIVIQ